MKRIFAFASAGALVIVLGIVGLFGASPASAQYTPVGGFTVTPSVTFPDTNVSVKGYCMVGSTVTVQYDGGPVIGTAVVPVPANPPPGTPPWQSAPGETPAWVITNEVTVPSHIPANATVGPHTLTVKCNGQFVQNLAITVINPTCNTGGRLSFDNLDGHEGVKPPGQTPPASPSLTGTVTSSSTNLPLKYATVKVIRASNNTSVSSGVQTDVNGKFYWGPLAAGSYKIQYVYLGFVTVTGPTFTYSSGLLTKDMALAPAATAPGIQGTVYDATTGQTLDGATVRLWQYPNLYQYVSVPTNSGGKYNFVGVPAGEYKLQYSAPNYQTLWFPSSPDQNGGSVITLTVGSKPTIDAKIIGTCAGANANSYNQGIGNPPIPPGSTFANIAGPAGAIIVSSGALLLMLNRRRISMRPVLAGDGAHLVDSRPRRLHHFVLHHWGHSYFADSEGLHGLPVPWKRVALMETKVRSTLGRRTWVVSKETRLKTRQRLR